MLVCDLHRTMPNGPGPYDVKVIPLGWRIFEDYRYFNFGPTISSLHVNSCLQKYCEGLLADLFLILSSWYDQLVLQE